MTYAELIALLQESLKAGGSVALVTVTSAEGSVPREVGAKMLVFPDGSAKGTIGGGRLEARAVEDAVRALAEGGSRGASYELEPQSLGMYCAGRVGVFIDVFQESLKLVILGAGHVGEKTAELAGFLGLPHSVADDRPEFARSERFPKARQLLLGSPAEALERLRADPRTAVVIVTRCHGFDLRCLVAALQSRAFYIGMIGSRTKILRLFELCQRRGLDPASDPRVHAPIGLDLGGRAPEMIALSILAEIVKARHNASGRSMRIAESEAERVHA